MHGEERRTHKRRDRLTNQLQQDPKNQQRRDRMHQHVGGVEDEGIERDPAEVGRIDVRQPGQAAPDRIGEGDVQPVGAAPPLAPVAGDVGPARRVQPGVVVDGVSIVQADEVRGEQRGEGDEDQREQPEAKPEPVAMRRRCDLGFDLGLDLAGHAHERKTIPSNLAIPARLWRFCV